MAYTRPKWLDKYLKASPAMTGVKDQVTPVGVTVPGGAKQMPSGYMFTGRPGQPKNTPTYMAPAVMHADETVVPQAQTKALGGPDGVAKVVDHEAMKRLARMPGVQGFADGGNPFAKEAALNNGLTSMDNPNITPTSAAPGVTRNPYALQNMQQSNNPYARQAAANNGLTSMSNPSITTPNKAPAATTPSIQPVDAAGYASASAALTKTLGRQLTADEQKNLAGMNRMQQEQYLGAHGLGAAAGNTPVQKATLPGVSTASAGNTANQMLQQTKDLATGNSAVYKKISDAAFQSLDARLANQMTATAMQIANSPNMTDAQKLTAMAEQLMANGVADATLAGNIANNAISTAMSATGQAYSMATSERSYADTQINNAINDALSAGDFNTVSDLYKQKYGITMDMTNIKNEYSANQLAKGMETLGTVLTQFPTATLATPGVKSSLQQVWTSDPANVGKAMPDSWANQQLKNYKDSNSPFYQALNGLTPEMATDILFHGDTGKLDPNNPDAFKYEGYKPGLESAQHAFADIEMTGGLTWDKTTNTFDVSNISNNKLYQNLFGGIPDYVTDVSMTDSTGKTTTSPVVGGTLKANDTDYVIKNISSDGKTLTLTSKDGKITSTATADTRGGYHISTSTDKTLEGIKSTQGQPATFNGDPMTATISGQQQQIYGTSTAGIYNTKPDGSGVNVKVVDNGMEADDTTPKAPTIIPQVLKASNGTVMFGDQKVTGDNGAITKYFNNTLNGINIGIDARGDAYSIDENGETAALKGADLVKAIGTNATGSARIKDSDDTAPLKTGMYYYSKAGSLFIRPGLITKSGDADVETLAGMTADALVQAHGSRMSKPDAEIMIQAAKDELERRREVGATEQIQRIAKSKQKEY